MRKLLALALILGSFPAWADSLVIPAEPGAVPFMRPTTQEEETDFQARAADQVNVPGRRADQELATPLNKTLFEALWSLRQAAGAAGQLPVITKAQYRNELKNLLLGFQ